MNRIRTTMGSMAIRRLTWLCRLARETFPRERLTFSQADVPRHHFTEYTPDSFKTELSEAGLRLTPFEINRGEIWAEAVPSRA